jgi:predicted secreted Zn-dependent protease
VLQEALGPITIKRTVRLRPLSLALFLILPGEVSALVRSSIVRPQSSFSVSSHQVYYQIQGNTAADLRAQMDRLGPVDRSTGKRYDAFANWIFSWRYRDRVVAGMCRFTGVKLVVQLKYTYPRWSPPAGVSARLARRWNRYLGVLRRHENGHGAIAVREGREILAQMRAIGPRGSCQRLQAAADLVGVRGVERTNRIEASYDARTSHGSTQGAHFP